LRRLVRFPLRRLFNPPPLCSSRHPPLKSWRLTSLPSSSSFLLYYRPASHRPPRNRATHLRRKVLRLSSTWKVCSFPHLILLSFVKSEADFFLSWCHLIPGSCSETKGRLLRLERYIPALSLSRSHTVLSFSLSPRLLSSFRFFSRSHATDHQDPHPLSGRRSRLD